MSILSKQIFVTNLERQLGSILTVCQLDEVVKIINSQLSCYELEQCADSVSCDLNGVLELFLDAKRIEGCSEKTIAHYKYCINRLAEDIKTPLHSITVFHLRSYLMNEKKRGIADLTINGYRCIFSSFFGWASKEGLIERNPCTNLSKIKSAKKVKLPLDDVDIERLKIACTNLRDKAIIMFLLSTGCRISEVCGINRSDLDFHNLECTVLGKGNKERTVYFDSVTSMIVKNYLDSRSDQSEALFVGKGNKRLLPGGVRVMLNKLADAAGVEHVHPHRFRRTLATNLIDRGMTVQEVARILGHENINTTMTYIYINKTNVKISYQKHI